MVTMLSEEDQSRIKSRIAEIINSSDLNSITVKGIRESLEEKDNRDYTAEKSFISEAVKESLQTRIEREQQAPNEIAADQDVQDVDTADDYLLALELQKAEETSGRKGLRRRQGSTARKYSENLFLSPSKSKKGADSAEKEKKRTGRAFNKPLLLSNELRDIFGQEYREITRPDCVKKLWEYIKRNDLQDPKDKRIIVCDEALLAVFKKPRVSCFGMNKILSHHLHRKDDVIKSHDDSEIEEEVPDRDVEVKSNGEKRTSRSAKKTRISEEQIFSEDEDDGSTYGLGQEEDGQKNRPPSCSARGSDSKTKTSGHMNPLLLQVPGVSEDMSYSAVQVAILAYTQVAKLRQSSDTDYILLKKDDPVYHFMGVGSEGKVHICELINRIQDLYSSP